MQAVNMREFPTKICTDNLKLADVPEPTADWHSLAFFALTFDPKEADPYEIKDQDFKSMTADTDLVHLRSRLFFEQRRWNHFGREPDATAMDGVKRILSLIRTKLRPSS